MNIKQLKSLPHSQAAMSAMMDSQKICIFDAWRWNDERLHASINDLVGKGVPINTQDAPAVSPVTDDASIKRYYFIDFNLLGDEEAAKAREIERTVKQFERAISEKQKLTYYIKKLSELGYEVPEEQFDLFKQYNEKKPLQD